MIISLFKKTLELSEKVSFSEFIFSFQVQLMKFLGETRRSYLTKAILVLFSFPIFFTLGYGDIAEKLEKVGLTSYDNLPSNLISSVMLYLHWIGYLYPYLLAFNIAVFLIARMWSKKFWCLVEE